MKLSIASVEMTWFGSSSGGELQGDVTSRYMTEEMMQFVAERICPGGGGRSIPGEPKASLRVENCRGYSKRVVKMI